MDRHSASTRLGVFFHLRRVAVQFHQQHGRRIPGQAGLAEIFHRPDGKIVQKLQGGGNDPIGNDGGHGFRGPFQ
jgi:hypothetical protein